MSVQKMESLRNTDHSYCVSDLKLCFEFELFEYTNILYWFLIVT